MRREDDTRQAQTQTDAADTSECLSIVLFILGVTSHPEWSARHSSAEGVASSAHTRLWSVFIVLFGCDFLRREGGFKCATLQLRGLLIRLWMMLLMFVSLSKRGLLIGEAVFLCV